MSPYGGGSVGSAKKVVFDMSEAFRLDSSPIDPTTPMMNLERETSMKPLVELLKYGVDNHPSVKDRGVPSRVASYLK